MSDAELLVSEGSHSKNGAEILSALPPWMPDHESQGNFKLLDVIGRAIDRIEGDVADVDNASNVQTAESVEQLRELATLVDLPPLDGESLEKYRTRSIAKYQTITTEGSAEQLLNNTATILETDISNIGYIDLDENGAIQLKLPGSAVDNSPLTTDELISNINNQSAAGFRVEASLKGTFTYITPTDYNNGNHDATKGYDGLDANGDPKDNGGTYAGLI